MPVVLVEKQTPQITLITLNRPERRNALTIELMSELTAAIENTAADPRQRILILRGAGKAFCTGLDLDEATKQQPHATAEMVARMLLALAETRLVTLRSFTAPLLLAARELCQPAILSSPPKRPKSAIPK